MYSILVSQVSALVSGSSEQVYTSIGIMALALESSVAVGVGVGVPPAPCASTAPRDMVNVQNSSNAATDTTATSETNLPELTDVRFSEFMRSPSALMRVS